MRMWKRRLCFALRLLVCMVLALYILTTKAC